VHGITVSQNSVYITVLYSKVENNGTKMKINQMLLNKLKPYTSLVFKKHNSGHK